MTGTVLVLLGATLTAASALQAQTVAFTSVQTTIVDTGVLFPTSVAMNKSGDLFLADPILNRVVKVSPTGAQSLVGTGLDAPQGVAMEATGNVLIADSKSGRVLRVTPAGVQTIVVSGLLGPMGVAVDRGGTIYIAEAYRNRVMKVSTNGSTSLVGTGLKSPSGVAVDGAGNLLIADTGNGRVVRVDPSGAQVLVTNQLASPYGVSADDSGNVYIADTNNSRIVRVSPNTGLTDLDVHVSHPWGVLVKGADTLLVADSDFRRVLEVQLTAANFGSVNICPSGQSTPEPCSRTLTLHYHISNGGNLGGMNVLTKGAPNADFKWYAGNCTGIVSAGSGCAVDVTFAPQAPGARLGGVEITDSNGKVLATTFVSGQGQGAAVAYGPGTQTAVANGLSSPTGVAVDGLGNVLIAEFSRNRVIKVYPNGDQTVIGTGLRFPSAVAVGGAGNVIVSDTGNNRVVRVRTHGGDQTTLAEGLNLPQGVAIDGVGNLFIADYGNNRVLKIEAATGVQTTLGVGLRLPYGVAIDGSGNVFIADYGNNRVVKVAPNGAQSQVAGGLSSPTSVAVDAGGSIFIGDTGNDRVVIVSPDGSVTPVGTSLFGPQGVALDAAGNIVIADSRNNRVVKVQRSVAPALTFAATLVGKSDGPQSIRVWNIGNQRLNPTAPGLAISANFQQGPGGTAPIDCNDRTTLPPGGSCDLNISFVPQTGGALTGTVVLTNNAMNGAPSTQTINVSGMGVRPTTTTVQAAAGQYSDAVTLSATIGPPGLSFAGTLRISAGLTDACSVAVTGSGTYSCSYVIGQVAQSLIFRAEVTTTDPSVKGSVGFGTLTISPEDATIIPWTGNPTSIKVNSATVSGPFTLTALLRQASDGSLGDFSKPDSFAVTLTSSTGATVACSAIASAAGDLTATCRLVPIGSYTVNWKTTAKYFNAPTVKTSLTVTP